MNLSVRLFAFDLLKVERTQTPGPDNDGDYQHRFGGDESYLYLTPDEADKVADHFRQLADNMRKEATL